MYLKVRKYIKTYRMSPFPEDPDVDIIMSSNVLKVLVDLRGKDLKTDNILIKANKNGIYIFDKENKSVIKVISLPAPVDPKSVSFIEKFGTYIITLKKL